MAAADLVAEELLVIGKKKFLSEDEIKKITDAVVRAEQGTRGEIVPMIVARSSTIGHLPIYIALMLFSIILVMLIDWPPLWLSDYLNRWHGLPLVGLFAICWLCGFILSYVPSIQRWLIPNSDEESQVWSRARSEWAFNQLQKTKERTGILLFVSVMERKAVILADEGISKYCPEKTWQEVIDALTTHLKKGEWALGFETSVHRCGEILKANLPAAEPNKNELSDRVIIKD